MEDVIEARRALRLGLAQAAAEVAEAARLFRELGQADTAALFEKAAERHRATLAKTLPGSQNG